MLTCAFNLIRIRHDPLFATFLLQGIFAIFKSYPTLSDPGLFLSMLSIFPEIYPCQYSDISTVVLRILTRLIQISKHPLSPLCFTYMHLCCCHYFIAYGSLKGLETPTSSMRRHWCLD
jgi:GPI transamidase subunit PIG-U